MSLPQIDKNNTENSNSILPPISNNYQHNNYIIQPNTNISNDDAESNIVVAVRIRPLLPKETTIGEMDILRAEDKLLVTIFNVHRLYCFICIDSIRSC